MIMPTAELIAIIGTMLGVGLALAVLIMRSTARVDADRRALQVTMDAFRSESAADRRALQAAMDTFRTDMGTFRTEMMRLAERQTRLEAIQEIRARARGAEG